MSEERKYGCHSSLSSGRRSSYIAQDGYFNERSKTRIPNNVVIEDTMSKDCHYSIEKKDDVRCVGCSYYSVNV